MKGRNKVLLKETKKLFIAFLLILICMTTVIHATDITPSEGDTTEPVENAELPYIEMKVKAIKTAGTNQIVVECWGSNFTNFEAMEYVFTYNNTKLTPSNVDTNELITNLDSYKYEKRPKQAGDKPTNSELLEQAQFDSDSTETLKKAFNFESEYKDLLDIDLFRYLAPDGNNEAMQFMISKNQDTPDISATEPVLLGKFSFRQTEGTTMDETEFATNRIKISCNDGKVENDESYYVRDVANGENCTEIVEFTYEKYGSISGTIEASIEKDNGSKFLSKNICTLKLYKAEEVKDIDWTLTGTKTYIPMRDSLPEPYKTYDVTEDNIVDGQDYSNFAIENIEFGDYVMLIDKPYYVDFIITNLKIDSTNKELKLSELLDKTKEETKEGIIYLIPGDINKDGLVNSTDSIAYKKDLNNSDKTLGKQVDFDDKSNSKGEKNTSTDSMILKRAINKYTKDKTVKKIINL